MLSQFSTYLNAHPDFWLFLKQNPTWIEQLILCPECFELLKVKHKEHKNNQWITKIQNMTLLLKMMEMTND